MLFFPGGLGSELSRAVFAFGSGDAAGGNYGTCNQFWYDAAQILNPLVEAALWMQMRRDEGVHYDFDRGRRARK